MYDSGSPRRPLVHHPSNLLTEMAGVDLCFLSGGIFTLGGGVKIVDGAREGGNGVEVAIGDILHFCC